MVLEHEAEQGSRWATIESVAEKIGCAAQSLQRWVAQSEGDAGKRTGLSTSERDSNLQCRRPLRQRRRASRVGQGWRGYDSPELSLQAAWGPDSLPSLRQQHISRHKSA
jgi:hypothetical protein